MNSQRIKYLILTLFIAAFTAGCTESVLAPDEIPVEVLLSAPDTIEIEGKKIILNSYLWRDFMPISPPDGKPLIALVYIETIDSSDIPASIEPQAVYIINDDQVWHSHFENETPPDNRPFRLARIARDGPKWGPGIFVDVVVLLNIDKEEKLLRAPHQYINRTD